MKPESPFSKLPTMGELLQHPTVQGVVQRVNQTTIAQRATGFWEELQANWQGQGPMPSMGELAQRLAQRLLGSARHSTPTINATGILCSRNWQPPLAEAAFHELLRVVSDYQGPSPARMDQVAESLVKQTGAEAAWVASSFEAAVSMTAANEDAQVVAHRFTGLLNPAEFGKQHVDTIADHLGAGADLVVLDGAGLLGGPRCGIVVGAKEQIEQLRANELAPVLAAEAMVLASLEATLEIYRSPDKVMHQIPLFQLLSAPLENLQQRCERIAPLLAECDLVSSAEAVPCDSLWLDTGDTQHACSTWAISLRTAEIAVERLAQLFDSSTPQVVGRVENNAYQLDFRAIFPRWDQQLVATLEQRN